MSSLVARGIRAGTMAVRCCAASISPRSRRGLASRSNGAAIPSTARAGRTAATDAGTVSAMQGLTKLDRRRSRGTSRCAKSLRRSFRQSGDVALGRFAVVPFGPRRRRRAGRHTRAREMVATDLAERRIAAWVGSVSARCSTGTRAGGRVLLLYELRRFWTQRSARDPGARRDARAPARPRVVAVLPT